MTRQVLIELSTGKVLGSGYMDMTTSSSFDPAVHGVVENDTFPIPNLTDDDGNEVLIYWDGTTFTQTAP